jgi:hypothetical protein
VSRIRLSHQQYFYNPTCAKCCNARLKDDNYCQSVSTRHRHVIHDNENAYKVSSWDF